MKNPAKLKEDYEKLRAIKQKRTGSKKLGQLLFDRL